VLHLAHRRGMRVPDDLAVVGFDNIPESAQFWPPLTTVKHDLQELGRLTVQHVVQMIEAGHGADNGYRPEMTWLKPELLVRESSVRVKRDE
jgi:LacI family transcriptional regulator